MLGALYRQKVRSQGRHQGVVRTTSHSPHPHPKHSCLSPPSMEAASCCADPGFLTLYPTIHGSVLHDMMELMSKWQDLNPEPSSGAFYYVTTSKYQFVPSFKGDSGHIYKEKYKHY